MIFRLWRLLTGKLCVAYRYWASTNRPGGDYTEFQYTARDYGNLISKASFLRGMSADLDSHLYVMNKTTHRSLAAKKIITQMKIT